MTGEENTNLDAVGKDLSVKVTSETRKKQRSEHLNIWVKTF